MQGRFTAVPNLVMLLYSELGISSLEMMLVLHVWVYWYDHQSSMHPALSTIAERMGMTRRQLCTHVKHLKEKKYKDPDFESQPYLQVHERYASQGGQLSNQYDFTGFLDAVKYLARKKGWLKEEEQQRETPERRETSSPPMKKTSPPPMKKTSHEEDEDKEEDFKKTKNLRIRRADALNTKRDEAACSHIAHGTTRKTSNGSEQTRRQDAKNGSVKPSKIPCAKASKSEPEPLYIGKPLSQEEINQRKKEGKNVSGMTSLSQLLSGHRQELKERKQHQEQDETIPDTTRTQCYDSPSTKNVPLFIRANIGQLSELLGDEPESIPQDMNRAAKLYEQSKLSEDEFREVIFDLFRKARNIPDERIKTRRKDGKPNKMLLFFSMLKAELGLKQEAG
jgi:hypothetical protein